MENGKWAAVDGCKKMKIIQTFDTEAEAMLCADRLQASDRVGMHNYGWIQMQPGMCEHHGCIMMQSECQA